jgi:hypothetical protein
MATLAMKIKAERRMRELLADAEVAQPDHVEYGYGCIRLFWDGPKVVIVVDIDDYGEIGESALSRGDVEVGEALGEHDGSDAEVFPMRATKNGNGANKHPPPAPRRRSGDEAA